MKKPFVQTQRSCIDSESEYGTLHVDDALNRMLTAVNTVPGYRIIPTKTSVGHVLDQTIASPINVPTHTNAAVDGYAMNSEELPSHANITEIPVVGEALAGKPYGQVLSHNQCIRITTGAKIPSGADTVIMQEHVELDNNKIRIDDRHKKGQNVRQAGEDIKQGQTVLSPGKLLTPADIGIISSLGVGEIKVKRKPRIAVFSTGDELHDIGDILPVDGIFDSNRYTLCSALQRIGVDFIDLGIIPDNKSSLLKALTENALDVDAIITSGGVSVGQADYVKELLAKLGTIEFWKVAIKPGRPLAFGKINNTVFFGLPGNPVAVMVTYYQFVRPTLQKMMGITDAPVIATFEARSTERIRKKPGRTEVQRGILQKEGNGEWVVRTTGKQGSGILTSMSQANAFIILPHQSKTVEPGDLVTVQPFSSIMSL